MQMRASTPRSNQETQQMQAETPAPPPQPCSLCSGELVMDAQGTALFCDDCWDHKWSLALHGE